MFFRVARVFDSSVTYCRFRAVTPDVLLNQTLASLHSFTIVYFSNFFVHNLFHNIYMVFYHDKSHIVAHPPLFLAHSLMFTSAMCFFFCSTVWTSCYTPSVSKTCIKKGKKSNICINMYICKLLHDMQTFVYKYRYA